MAEVAAVVVVKVYLALARSLNCLVHAQDALVEWEDFTEHSDFAKQFCAAILRKTVCYFADSQDFVLLALEKKAVAITTIAERTQFFIPVKLVKARSPQSTRTVATIGVR